MRTFATIACTMAISLAGLSSCKKEEKAPAPTPAAEVKDSEASSVPVPPAPAPLEEHLKIAESKIVVSVADAEASKTLVITAEGKIMAGDKEVASLSSKGEMTVAGEVVATLAKDGTVTFTQSGKTMSISEEGAVSDEGKVMMLWNEDKSLGGEAVKAMPGLSAVFEGPSEQRRAASYAFLIGMMSTSSTRTEPPVTREAPPPAPPAP